MALDRQSGGRESLDQLDDCVGVLPAKHNGQSAQHHYWNKLSDPVGAFPAKYSDEARLKWNRSARMNTVISAIVEL